MKKYIKNDNGSIRICSSNIAQMNIFEWMYYRRYLLSTGVLLVGDQIIKGVSLIGASVINTLLFLIYPIIGILEIRKAKKMLLDNKDELNIKRDYNE